MRKTNIYGNTELSKDEQETVNEALYYAVRENLNQKIDYNKSDLLREALDVMKRRDHKPTGPAVCNRSLDDFFSSCVKRDWGKELKEISWLEVGND
ncbi:MAG: hypothetical protein ACOC4Y_01845 [bacterium]